MTASGDDAMIGRIVDGRYRIDEAIARGGMASVFRAHDERLNRIVAIKIMHQGLGDDESFTNRFVREAQAAAQLNHPHVVAVFDQGTDGDVTYLVMEHVDGPTLRDVMRREVPMPVDRALSITEQVLLGLAAAHSAGFIHRDIKPENVLITRSGRVKVVDFGLARAVSSATTATGNTLIGTISYLAPEIVVHEGSDARSDVYACGAMLYEMLTGLKPHGGDSPIQVAYKHVHHDIGPPSAMVESIPDFVDALIARATARDRNQRAADASVFLRQIRRVQLALAEGLRHDSELAADIAPSRPHVDPADQADPASALDVTTDLSAALGATPPEQPAEPTLHWAPEPGHVLQAPDNEAPSASKDEPSSAGSPPRPSRPPRPPRRRRRGLWLLILVILIALLAAGIGWYYGIGRYDSAPNMVGSTWSEAQATAKKTGFTIDMDHRAYSETVPTDVVISTDPPAGAKILPGKSISVVVSKGKERYHLPKGLKRMSLSKARKEIEALHLKIGEIHEKHNEKVAEGEVVKAIDYTPDDALKRNTVIDLVVSKGKKPIDIPDVVGMPIDDAQAKLTDAGFTVDSSKQYSSDVDKGDVFEQDPRGGTGHKGDSISLTVSKGPEMVKVPDVVGKHKDEAVKIIEDAGLEADTFGPGDFKIRHQSPAEGEKVKPGATVNLTFF